MIDLIRLTGFLLRISRAFTGSRLRMAVIVAAGILSGLGNTALIALINHRIDVGEAVASWISWSFLGLLLAVPISRFLSQYLLVSLGARSILHLRLQLCSRILRAPLRRLEKIGPPKLIAHLTDDLGAIGEALVQIPLLCMHFAIVVGCLVYLGWLSWSLLLIVLGGMAVGMVSYQIPVLRSMHHFRLSRERWDALMEHFEGLTWGVKELKLHRRRRRRFVDDLYQPAAEDIRRHSVRGNAILTAANSWGHVLFFAVIGVVVFLIAGRWEVSDGVLVGYTLTLLYMMSPLEVILNTLPNMSRAKIAAERVESLRTSLASGMEAEEAEAGGAEEGTEAEALEEGASEEQRALPLLGPTGEWEEIRLEGVTHTFYNQVAEDEFELGPVDLAIRPGELLFLVGGNGSGKTTLAKLLAGLYEPEEGRITLDGRPIGDGSRDDYRQMFSAVFTDFYLFDRLLGLESPELDRRARSRLEELQLDHKVRIEDGTLSTLDLSQGQRKRLALLVAYLEDRPVCLFDEWAADQDPHFREVFYHQLLPDLRDRGKAVIVISHDDRYYHVADRMMKLDYGKIVHEESRKAVMEGTS